MHLVPQAVRGSIRVHTFGVPNVFKTERTCKMRTSKTWLAAALAALCVSPLMAQNSDTEQAPNTAAQNLQKLDSTTSGFGLRISKLMGLKLQNSARENVGQIKDVVIDPVSTRVQ